MIEAAFLFVLCWLLAQMEVQIEGPYGWAEKQPTWRWSRPWLLKLTNGKPATGYHCCLFAFLIGMFHLPLLFVPFSRAVEARILSDYLFMAVVWDFQWFVWNPHWGAGRLLREGAWWYAVRILGWPLDYYVGVAASGASVWLLDPSGLGGWARLAFYLAAATAASIPAVALWRRGNSAASLASSKAS